MNNPLTGQITENEARSFTQDDFAKFLHDAKEAYSVLYGQKQLLELEHKELQQKYANLFEHYEAVLAETGQL